MKKNKKNILFLFILLPMLVFSQNSKPVISNFSYENNVATKTILIQFDVFDAEEDEVEVLLRASFNDGVNFFVQTDSAYGDIGFPVEIGTNKTITWYYGNFWDNIDGNVLRLIVDDLYEINIDDLVAQVDSSRLRSMLEFISKPRSFQIGIEHLHTVRDTIYDLLESYDYKVRKQFFPFEGFTGANVIGRKQGLTEERKTVIMDAHYDAYLDAPGADDNGSGVVGFMEAARILSAYDFDKSLEFIGFDSEENFLLGSIHYAFFGGIEAWKEIVGVLNFEMIGYYSEDPQSQIFPDGFDLLFPSQYEELIEDSFRGNFIFIVGNMASVHMVEAFENAALDYVQDLKIINGIVPLNGLVAPDLLRSDHAPFWFRGVPGVMITDGAEFRNFDYHTENDVIENLDFEFMANITKTCMAAMIDLAGIRHSTTKTFEVGNIVTPVSNSIQTDCSISLYPNPVSTKLNIDLTECFYKYQRIIANVFDVTGKLILDFKIDSDSFELDISDLSCGQYTLKLSADDSYQSYKFVVH